MFGKLVARRKTKKKANRDSLHLYQHLVTHARSSYFYLPPFNVEDTVEGRFEMILIHLFMIDFWLSASDDYVLLRRTLQETLITDMDRSLREMGIGDMSVGKQMKQVGAALLGRLQSYKMVFDNADNSTDIEAQLAEILNRNIKGLEEPKTAKVLAGYIVSQKEGLSTADPASWQPGDSVFTDPTK